MVRVLRILHIEDVPFFTNEDTDIAFAKTDSLSSAYVLYGQEQLRPV